MNKGAGPQPDEQWFDAVIIQRVEVKRYDGIEFVRCPYCKSLNRMSDDLRGLHICGKCHVPFDVI